MRGARDSLARIAALARFAVESNLGRWVTRGGLLTGMAIMALGSVLSVQQGTGWRFDDDFGLMGFVVMALFAVRSGLEEQRELGLTTFTAHNLASRTEHAAAFVVAAMAIWGLVCAVGYTGVLIASGGDASTAAWTTAGWGLRLLVLLGFVPLVESITSVRLPLLLPVFAYLGIVIALTVVLTEERALGLIVVLERGDVASYARLAAQGTAFLVGTTTMFVLTYTTGPDLHAGLRKVVPTRH